MDRRERARDPGPANGLNSPLAAGEQSGAKSQAFGSVRIQDLDRDTSHRCSTNEYNSINLKMPPSSSAFAV
jgi:hypothetical protein